MQKFLLLLAILMLSLTTRSQTYKTSTTDSITMLRSKADILLRSHRKLDLCAKEVDHLKKDISSLEEEISLRKEKQFIADQRILNFQQLVDVYKLETAMLEDNVAAQKKVNQQITESFNKQIKQLKGKVVKRTILGGIIIGTLTYLLITK